MQAKVRDQIILNMQVRESPGPLDQVLSSHRDTTVLITGGYHAKAVKAHHAVL